MNKQGLKVLLLCLGILLVMVMVLSACGTKTTTTTTAATTTQTTTTTAATSTATTTTTKPPTTTAPTSTTATSTTPAKIVPTGTLRVAAQDFSWESMDPIYYESTWGWSMYDTLVTWDPAGNYIPNVAESWTISPDGKTWTFKIRKDIKFWDGTPLTAADVKFSVDRFGGADSTNPWSRYISEAYNKAGSALIDDYTFQFVSARPEPAQIIAFAWTRILPKAYFEKVGKEGFQKAPMGSGPWKFVSHIAKTSVTMEANTNYWIPSRVPKFKTFINLLVPEEATAGQHAQE